MQYSAGKCVSECVWKGNKSYKGSENEEASMSWKSEETLHGRYQSYDYSWLVVLPHMEWLEGDRKDNGLSEE